MIQNLDPIRSWPILGQPDSDSGSTCQAPEPESKHSTDPQSQPNSESGSSEKQILLNWPGNSFVSLIRIICTQGMQGPLKDAGQAIYFTISSVILLLFLMNICSLDLAACVPDEESQT